MIIINMIVINIICIITIINIMFNCIIDNMFTMCYYCWYFEYYCFFYYYCYLKQNVVSLCSLLPWRLFPDILAMRRVCKGQKATVRHPGTKSGSHGSDSPLVNRGFVFLFLRFTNKIVCSCFRRDVVDSSIGRADKSNKTPTKPKPGHTLGVSGPGGARTGRMGRGRVGSPRRQPFFNSPANGRQPSWACLWKHDQWKPYVNRWRYKASF